MYSMMNLQQKNQPIGALWSETQTRVDRLLANLRGKWMRVDSFKPKLSFLIRSGDFTLRTAENPDDLKRVCRFRFENFFSEQSEQFKFALDLDRFDSLADHLMVFDDRSGRLVGTYRILSSKFTDIFYTDTEFDLNSFLKLKGEKLELGRACVAPKFRSGRVIQLLWRGIAEYIKRTRPDYVFGCASLDKIDPLDVNAVTKFLLSEYVYEGVSAIPRRDFRYPNLDFLSSQDTNFSVRDLSPLFRCYLAVGAKIMGPPALDRDFMCVDFPIILEMKNLSDAARRKFFEQEKV